MIVRRRVRGQRHLRARRVVRRAGVPAHGAVADGVRRQAVGEQADDVPVASDHHVERVRGTARVSGPADERLPAVRVAVTVTAAPKV